MDKLQELLTRAFTEGWMPFFMVTSGKPKPNAIRLVEIMLILGFLWWRMDAVEAKIDANESRREKVEYLMFNEIKENRSGIYTLNQRVSEIWGTLNAED